ncbi:MAG: hypothetical protein UT18_C0019G0019 [candidate division CPR2 bacterium GW2011_GWC2_39_10]|uniref:Uncharacterized protein n=1 Tax=candidate division CPR2 bacterium GW2011_GWC2_39_10 TaxID=1618345 RepID=A0A0G0LR41_UNCC2|nr:MAG: hypothetical protein UT18_C0019G0019 [candidate division CPR2 bacterium GW2011_GWC2_39_10]
MANGFNDMMSGGFGGMMGFLMLPVMILLVIDLALAGVALYKYITKK